MSLAAHLRPFVEANQLAGAVLLAARKDKPLALESVGHADVASQKTMTDDALFWIASMTKPIVATAFMMLAEEGKASLDDTLQQYVPAFTGQMMIGARSATGDIVTLVNAPRPCTIREAFCHTSGMPFFSRPEQQPRLRIDGLPLELAAMSYAMSPLEFVPGTKYQYGNTGINTVGRVIEIVSGRPFEVFLQERIFGPLGMVDTTFFPTEAQLSRLAKSYKLNNESRQLEPADINFLTYPLSGPGRYACPGGGLFSTARDMMRFGQMILGGGAFEGRRYLSPASVRTMTTTQTGDLHQHDASNPESGYGLGWQTTRRDPGNTNAALLGPCGHGGAFATHLGIDPARDLVTVYMVQYTNMGDLDAQMRTAFLQAAQALADEA